MEEKERRIGRCREGRQRKRDRPGGKEKGRERQVRGRPRGFLFKADGGRTKKKTKTTKTTRMTGRLPCAG